MTDFLPSDYKEEKSGYAKLEEGENRFRILSSAIVGWEYWNENNEGARKPIRKRLTEDLIIGEIQEPDTVRKFWAFVVWNYKQETIQILELTQKSIKNAILSLIKNPKWGSPVNSYDIVIIRQGTDKNTKYSVTPDPREPTTDKILNEYNKTYINLDALFRGEDPFLPTIRNVKEDISPDEIPL